MAEIICPACGSSDVIEEHRDHTVKMAFGITLPYFVVENRCRTCGEVGDFFIKSDESIKEAIKEAELKSLDYMLDRLTSEGITNTYFERALGLPNNTIVKWKKGEYSASTLALLKIVTMFPWVLDAVFAERSK